jgi:hypothetical protein
VDDPTGSKELVDVIRLKGVIILGYENMAFLSLVDFTPNHLIFVN